MKRLLITLLILGLLLLGGCATSVKDISDNPDKYMGKRVILEGEVSAPLDLGKMKGFTLREGSSSVMVSSETVPGQGDRVTIRGTMVRGMLTGPYIYADKVAVRQTRAEIEAED